MTFWRKPKILSPEDYQRIGQEIWTSYVPASGQSKVVQGELLRAIEKLRDETHRNGNANWDSGHVQLVDYIRDTLMAQPDISGKAKRTLTADLKRLADFENPYLQDDLFDRISRIILDWCVLNPDPKLREINPELER